VANPIPKRLRVPALLLGVFLLSVAVTAAFPELLAWLYGFVLTGVTSLVTYFGIKDGRHQAAQEAAETAATLSDLREAEETAHAEAQDAQDALERDERVTF
jgi:hypothetical protein